MGLISNLRGNIKYRIRIFHDNYHIKTVTVKAKGQRFVTVLVENPLIGHKEKLAFMVPHDIKPFVFQGKFLEFNYDIRDATPLTDLTDLFPNFVHDLNEDLKTLLIPENYTIEDLYENKVIDVEVTERNPPKKEEEAKTDDTAQDQQQEQKQTEPQPDPDSSVPVVTEVIKKESIVKKKVESAVKVTKDSGTLLKEMVRLHLADDAGKRDEVKKIMSICARHPKTLWWLPAALNIDKEIYSLCSAKRIRRAGVMPSYYAAQSGALISEKVLERPKEQPSWITVALVGVIGIVIIALLLIATRKP